MSLARSAWRTGAQIIGYSLRFMLWCLVIVTLLMGAIFLSAFGPRSQKDF